MDKDTNEKAAKIARDAAAYVRRGWTQGADARDIEGKPVELNDPKACSWCMGGALDAAFGAMFGGGGYDARYAGYDLMLRTHAAVMRRLTEKWLSVVDFNDDERRTQEEVVALLEATAALLEATAEQPEATA